MQAWKPLLIVIPAGLVLGVVGGHYARPVMTQRGAEDASQPFVETRSQRSGTATAEAPSETVYYSGGYSYPPYLDDSSFAAEPRPDFADWPEYEPAPMPTIAELKAGLAARDAALDQLATAEPIAGPQDQAAAGDATDVGTAAGPPRPIATDPRVAVHPKLAALAPGQSAVAASPEPRTAGGALPAIW